MSEIRDELLATVQANSSSISQMQLAQSAVVSQLQRVGNTLNEVKPVSNMHIAEKVAQAQSTATCDSMKNIKK